METPTLRLAVAQTTVREDPRSKEAIREGGREVRRLMHEAHAAGARLVHFPEGAICSPGKRAISSDPDQVSEAAWDRAEWDVLREELSAVASLARELRLWSVLGSVHRLTPPHRPHNSLYVISDRGVVTTRYDERLLSRTKLSFMYSPGSAPVTFEVDGVRFGCALGMEVHFPELFLEYERLDVDCVLFSSAGPGTGSASGGFVTAARAGAATNSYWVSYAVLTLDTPHARSGVISPEGEWLVRCPRAGSAALAVVGFDNSGENLARPWRRTARSGIYDAHQVHSDPRSDDRAAF